MTSQYRVPRSRCAFFVFRFALSSRILAEIFLCFRRNRERNFLFRYLQTFVTRRRNCCPEPWTRGKSGFWTRCSTRGNCNCCDYLGTWLFCSEELGFPRKWGDLFLGLQIIHQKENFTKNLKILTEIPHLVYKLPLEHIFSLLNDKLNRLFAVLFHKDWWSEEESYKPVFFADDQRKDEKHNIEGCKSLSI